MAVRMLTAIPQAQMSIALVQGLLKQTSGLLYVIEVTSPEAGGITNK